MERVRASRSIGKRSRKVPPVSQKENQAFAKLIRLKREIACFGGISGASPIQIQLAQLSCKFNSDT